MAENRILEPLDVSRTGSKDVIGKIGDDIVLELSDVV
jgi:hypothetical protein